MAVVPIEAQEIPEYEGPYDGKLPNEMEMDADMTSKTSIVYNLRPKKKRSCSPAKRTAPPPKTVPR